MSAHPVNRRPIGTPDRHPVLIDGENRILAGHGRVEAARELGMATAPCLRIDHMSATDKRAYVLADNKLALFSYNGYRFPSRALQFSAVVDPGFSLIGADAFPVPVSRELVMLKSR